VHATQNGNESLAAAATHLLIKMIKIDDNNSLERENLKRITELLSGDYARCR
jgi:hypothetical protein